MVTCRGNQWISCFFFFNDTATTEIYTLSLHDALPILFLDRVMLDRWVNRSVENWDSFYRSLSRSDDRFQDRKSTRLNSSHSQISYAVFCLKKKNTPDTLTTPLSSVRDVSLDASHASPH